MITMESSKPEKVFVGTHTGDMTKYVREFIRYAIEVEGDPSKGVCYFGLLACACQFESVLEDFTVSWCKVNEDKENDIYLRLFEKIGNDVSRATGLEAWKTWMKVLFNVNLPEVLADNWEAIAVLFRLRNQLAHGRTTKFQHFYKENGQFLGMSTEGSPYEKPLKYLMENKIVSLSKNEIPSANCFLTSKVVSHFSHAVESAILKLQSCPNLDGLRHYSTKLEKGIGPQNSKSLEDYDLIALVDDEQD